MLDKATKAEIRELYDGSFGSVREVAELFNVRPNTVRYLVNHKGYRDYIKNWVKKWQKKNPKRWQEINRKAGKKYYNSHSEECRERYRKYYLKNKKKERARQRKYYRLKKRKMNLGSKS